MSELKMSGLPLDKGRGQGAAKDSLVTFLISEASSTGSDEDKEGMMRKSSTEAKSLHVPHRPPTPKME